MLSDLIMAHDRQKNVNGFDDRKFTVLTDDNVMSSAIVIGGHSTIAQTIIQRLLHDRQTTHVYVFSRRPANFEHPRLSWQTCQYDETAIQEAMSALPDQLEINRLIICNGILHQDSIQPEKRLEQIDSMQLHQLFDVNTIIPMLWLKQLMPRLRQQPDCRIAVFSARVASINDNRYGGWYGYRASKAALNMLLKSASIELKRRSKGVSLLAFHPGTTDTPLSRPFHQNVSDSQLLAPETVAEKLLYLLDNRPPGTPFAFLDWQGKTVDW